MNIKQQGLRKWSHRCTKSPTIDRRIRGRIAVIARIVDDSSTTIGIDGEIAASSVIKLLADPGCGGQKTGGN